MCIYYDVRRERCIRNELKYFHCFGKVFMSIIPNLWFLTNSVTTSLPAGQPPKQRSLHASIVVGDCLYIFGGCANCADPDFMGSERRRACGQEAFSTGTQSGTLNPAEHGVVAPATGAFFGVGPQVLFWRFVLERESTRPGATGAPKSLPSPHSLLKKDTT